MSLKDVLSRHKNRMKCEYCELRKELSYFKKKDICKACEKKLKRINKEKARLKQNKLNRKNRK